MSGEKNKFNSPGDRILKVASQLFYEQGYQATGINQIIEESGVAKASFYSYFASKEELCVAYLKDVAKRELELVASTMEQRKSSLDRYLTMIDVLEPWLISTKFRGCPFINIASEVAEERSPIRKVGVEFYSKQKELVADCVGEMKSDSPKLYGKLNSEEIAEKYLMIMIGAIGLCEIFHGIEPIHTGTRMVRGLVER